MASLPCPPVPMAKASTGPCNSRELFRASTQDTAASLCAIVVHLMTSYGAFSLAPSLLYGGSAAFYAAQRRAMDAAYETKILTGQTRGQEEMFMQVSPHFVAFSSIYGTPQFSAAHRYSVVRSASPYPTCSVHISPLSEPIGVKF